MNYPALPKTKAIASLGLLLGGFSLLKTLALSQEPVRSFTISPPTVSFELKPGQSTEKSILITNNSDQPTTFVIDINDFIVTDKSGTPELIPHNSDISDRYTAATWATALPDRLTIEPGKKATTTLYLQVPGDAAPGGRYFAVTLRPTAGDGADADQSGAAINTIIGVLSYITVEGPVREEAKVVRFSAPAFAESGPIEITTEVKNLSDLHINPKGVVEVKNLFGQKVFSEVLPNYNIFPGTARVYTNTWPQKWLLGRYEASLAGYFGQSNVPLAANLVFWIIPYKLIAGLLLALVIIILASQLLRRRSDSATI